MPSCFSPCDGKMATAVPGNTPACVGGGGGKGTMTEICILFIRNSKASPETFQQTLIYTAMARPCMSAPSFKEVEKCAVALSSHRRESKPGGRNQIFETAGNVCHRAIEALLENSGSSRKASYYLLIIWSWMKTSQTQHSWVHDTELKKKVTIFFDQLDLGFF